MAFKSDWVQVNSSGFYANSISTNVNLDHNLSLLLIFSVVFFSYGLQESFSQQFSSDEFDLFIPEKMIVGEIYSGMITINNPTSDNTLFLINTDSDYLQVAASVSIIPNQNHGIFDIIPINEGTVEVFASYDGMTDSAVTDIYSEKTGPQKLDLILPGNSTIASDLTGFVFVVDGNGLPVEADRDIMIGLTSTEKISTPHNITIFNGTTNSVFDFTVKSTGSITAISTNLSSDTESITKSQKIVDVKMKIRPNIAAENTEINYVIWLEIDRKPYTVPYALNIQLQSSNTDIVRLGVSPSSYKNLDSVSISMRDGLVTGKLYTGESGVSEIFASISGYGTASEIISVGPVVLVDGVIIDEPNYTSDDAYRLYPTEPNYIIFDVFPDVTDDLSYGIASVYYSNSTEELDITLDDSGTQITNLVEHIILFPLKSEDILISISSEAGLTHNSNYLVDGASYPTHSKVFEIIADDVGEYTIMATGAKSHDDASLTVTTSYNTQYSIQLTHLPTKSDNPQPLVMVSIVDENENILDIGDSFGTSLTLNIDSDDLEIHFPSITLYDNIGVIHGTLSRVGAISVYSNEFGVATTSITPSGIPVSIEMLTPKTIHAGEKFPIIVHEVDASGTPINKKDVKDTSSSGFEKTDDQNIIIIPNQGAQQISILSKLGGVFQKTVDVFSNNMDFDVIAATDKARVGQSVIIEIESALEGIKYFIDSPFPYEQINDDTFLITPDHEVTDGQITIFGELDGFVTGNKKISLSSEDIAELKIITKTVDEQKISSPYTVSLGQDVQENDGPFTYLIKPQQTILEFSKEWSSAVGGYRLVELSLDGKTIHDNVIDFYLDGDSEITAVYDRFVKVTVIDGEGSGVYSYGEIVNITAPDKQIIPLLKIEKFDYWIGSSDEKSAFRYEAVDDLTVTAIYKDDYSGTMIVIVLGMAVLLVMIYKKGDGRIKYHLREISDLFRSKMKITLPKIDLIKKKQ